MLAGAGRQAREKLFARLGIAPGAAAVLEVVAPRARRQPYFLKRLLQVDHHLAAVGKRQRHHAAHALVVDICFRGLIELVAPLFDAGQQRLGQVHVFKVGHGVSTIICYASYATDAAAFQNFSHRPCPARLRGHVGRLRTEGPALHSQHPSRRGARHAAANGFRATRPPGQRARRSSIGPSDHHASLGAAQSA